MFPKGYGKSRVDLKYLITHPCLPPLLFSIDSEKKTIKEMKITFFCILKDILGIANCKVLLFYKWFF